MFGLNSNRSLAQIGKVYTNYSITFQLKFNLPFRDTENEVNRLIM